LHYKARPFVKSDISNIKLRNGSDLLIFVGIAVEALQSLTVFTKVTNNLLRNGSDYYSIFANSLKFMQEK
jgi:hypothetical protein